MDAFDYGTRKVPLIRGDQRVMGVLWWVHRRDRNYEILIQAPVGPVAVLERDLFVALQEVRRALVHRICPRGSAVTGGLRSGG